LDAVPLTLLFSLHNIYALAVHLIQEDIATDFNDLGTLLLGGFALAVVVAIALTFVRLRLRDKKVPTSEFISISSVEREE
jgi:adenine/guanine phosphoribosyltransferase-like PRPP-binding protein